MIGKIFDFFFMFFMFTAGVIAAGIVFELVYSSANTEDINGVLVFKEKVSDKGGLFSVSHFNVNIKDKSGRIYIMRSEDKQFGDITINSCVEARAYPYAPWKKRNGVYRDAFILRVYDCKGKKR